MHDAPFVRGFDRTRDLDPRVQRLADGLWSGKADLAGFSAGMDSTVQRGLRQAFADGIALEGLTEADLSQDELTMRDDRIVEEQQHITALGQYITEHSKASGAKFAEVSGRIDLWVARYSEVRYTGQLVAARDKKLEWRYGDTEHCPDCLMLNGRVYRASVWLKWGIVPRSHVLNCFGGHCQCGFYETDKPINKGRPPALKGPH